MPAYPDPIAYSLGALLSLVERYDDDDLVFVPLGDHQPGAVVSGHRASRDVPVTVIVRDPAVLDRITGWAWQGGLRPDHQAPVCPMGAFRDRFLTATMTYLGLGESAQGGVEVGPDHSVLVQGKVRLDGTSTRGCALRRPSSAPWCSSPAWRSSASRSAGRRWGHRPDLR